MLFYKVVGTKVDNLIEINDNDGLCDVNKSKLKNKTNDFNQKLCNNSFYFMSDCTNGILKMGVVSETSSDVRETVHSYLECIGIKVNNIDIKEITVKELENIMNSAAKFGFHYDFHGIIDHFGLGKFLKTGNKCFEYEEKIIEDSNKDSIYNSATKYLVSNSFISELDRIYSNCPSQKVHGHPVNYMVVTNDVGACQEVCSLLMQALHHNNRLNSRRYCFLEFNANERFDRRGYRALYKIYGGGTIIVQYSEEEDSEGTIHLYNQRKNIKELCKIANCYNKEVLTIICLSNKCKTAKQIFKENFKTLPVVEINEDDIDDKQAAAFLEKMAKDYHIDTDENLHSVIETGKGYHVSELEIIFDKWYKEKLRTSIFPQYKEITASKFEGRETDNKGKAYKELMEMIGLTDAKAVIQNVINYFNMQKLYKEKGIEEDSPMMHMVFTGNPGTAKTTVARLFAEIMRDNGVLYEGQLIEVGRGDLVDKYVGWTARNVKKKFRDAMGGILFIDEAYSLVDEERSSFGDEAINTIVQEMENHRKDLIVIFAGYPKEMEGFLQKNPGLYSRIAFHIHFDDYTVDELCQIAALMGRNKGIVFDKEAADKLRKVFEADKEKITLGNGRYVRSIIEQAKMKQASRLMELNFNEITKEDIATIKADDIVVPEIQEPKKQKIGFVF